MHVCRHACMHILYKHTFASIYIYSTLHMNTCKEQERLGERESEATHWHISLQFHLLCHCLTNCSTYSKHSSQQLGSKWGLHTPYKSLHPMLNFFKNSVIVFLPLPLPLSLAWSQFMFFSQNTHHNKH